MVVFILKYHKFGGAGDVEPAGSILRVSLPSI